MTRSTRNPTGYKFKSQSDNFHKTVHSNRLNFCPNVIEIKIWSKKMNTIAYTSKSEKIMIINYKINPVSKQTQQVIQGCQWLNPVPNQEILHSDPYVPWLFH